MAHNDGGNDSTGIIALLGLVGLGFLFFSSGGSQASGNPNPPPFPNLSMPGGFDRESTAQTRSTDSGDEGAGGDTGESSNTGGGGGDDQILEERHRPYFEHESTPNIPFGDIGRSTSRAERVSEGTKVGL